MARITQSMLMINNMRISQIHFFSIPTPEIEAVSNDDYSAVRLHIKNREPGAVYLYVALPFGSNGREPSRGDEIFVDGMEVSNPETICVKGFRGLEESVFMKFDVARCDTPLISIVGGGEGFVSFHISCRLEDATIHYTTDGLHPTVSSPVYKDGGITVKKNTPVQAIAVKDGLLISDYCIKNITVKLPEPELAFETNGDSGILSIANADVYDDYESVMFNLTKDGTGGIRTFPCELSENGSYKVYALNSSNEPSDEVTYGLFHLKCGTPEVDKTEVKYDSGETITITTGTENAQIYYTTDGTDPDESSKHYTIPLTVNNNITLKAIAYRDGIKPSDVLTVNITCTDIPVVGYDTTLIGYGNEIIGG